MTEPLEDLRRLAGPVSRETVERLLGFDKLLRRWNERINLVSRSEIEQIWERHVLDSAQLAGLKPDAIRWLDLGSGGGFPGIVLAAILAERGGAIDLVESNRKKAAFLQAAITELHLPARVHALRIEDAVGKVPQPQVVTARALASLPELLNLAAPWLLRGATGLFHKGRDHRGEVEESVHAWSFDLIEHRSGIKADSVILEVSDLRPSASRKAPT